MQHQVNTQSNQLFKNSKLLGHRGARGEVLENTDIGFIHAQQLISKKLSGIEFDVQLTQDKKLVIFHDESIDRIFKRQGKVSQLNADFFQQPVSRKQRNHKILTLDKIPSLLTGYEHIELEIKTHKSTNYNDLLCSLTKYLVDFPKLPITLTSFDKTLLFRMCQHPLLQHIPKGLLIDGLYYQPSPLTLFNTKDTLNIVNHALQLQCVQVGVQADLITPELVNQLHRYNLKITAWTVNDYQKATKLIEYGVDCIITDYPTMFLSKFGHYL